MRFAERRETSPAHHYVHPARDSKMVCNGKLHVVDLSNILTLDIFETLVDASNSYAIVHKYLGIILCVLGCLLNAVHIVVLTRRSLRTSAVNRLLATTAACNIVVMLSYTVFIIRFGFAVGVDNPPSGYPFHWAFFLLVHLVLSISMHTITLYLGVATAYIRFKSTSKLRCNWNRQSVAGPIFLSVALLVGVLSVPTFLLHSIVRVPEDEAAGELYTIEFTDFALLGSCGLFALNLWLTGILFKVAPCALLMLFTIALLRKLKSNTRRRSLIVSPRSLSTRKVTTRSDRTTKTLIVILMVFLVTELPQGALALVNSLFPSDLYQLVYLSFGELLDLLSLINCNACAVVYPLTSSRYRATFRGLWNAVPYRLCGTSSKLNKHISVNVALINREI